MTAIPKLPVKVGMHPGGAEPEGEMAAVTACGNGEALTRATAARIARVYCMLGQKLFATNMYEYRAMLIEAIESGWM